ncbi:hypothetical protein D1872_165430 [compost metagenome]
MTPINFGLLIGSVAFLFSCFLNLFRLSKKYIIYPTLISFVIGLVLIPLGFYRELGYLSLGFGMLVTSFLGVIVTISMHYVNRKKQKDNGYNIR